LSQPSKRFLFLFSFPLLSDKENVIAAGADEGNDNDRLIDCLQQSWVFGEDTK
jgi:hypothetical protein